MVPKIDAFQSDLKNRIGELLVKGHSANEIAEICKCSVHSVYEVKNSVKFQAQAYSSAVAKLVAVGAPRAVETLVELVNDKQLSPTLRHAVANTILTHTGNIVNERGELEKSPSTMTKEELQERLNLLQNEAANRAKTVVTVEPDKVDTSVDSLLG